MEEGGGKGLRLLLTPLTRPHPLRVTRLSSWGLRGHGGAKGDMVSGSALMQTGSPLGVGGIPMGAGPGDLSSNPQRVRGLQLLTLTPDL